MNYVEQMRQILSDATYAVSIIYATLTDEQREELNSDPKIKAFFEKFMVGSNQND